MTSNRSVSLQIALSTFGILVLELALIRWTSQQVRVFAYFNNLTLMAAFLGMGLGVALGMRRPSLRHWTLPSLLVLSVLLGLSEKLGILNLRFPDVSLVLWGGESLPNARLFIINVVTVLFLFSLIVEIFLCAGIIFSTLFSRSADAASSLGSNLLGAVVGGCLEYFSMLVGLRSLALVALTLYLGVLLMLRRREQWDAIAVGAE